MKSLNKFIISPLENRYDNVVKVGEKELITNTSVEEYKHVSNLAVVINTPSSIKTPIKKGDLIMIHHNVFRVFYDIRGNKKRSRSHFKDDLHFCSADQIYLYKNTGDWKSFGDRCFVAPVKNKDILSNEKTADLIGILKIGNSSLEASEITPGDIIGFTPGSEFEFVIDGEIMYCMKSNDIVIKYENSRNEEADNRSWTEITKAKSQKALEDILTNLVLS